MRVALFACVAACVGCNPPDPVPHARDVTWWDVTPPRPGLRCWMQSPETRAAVLFCEPDPTATRERGKHRREEKKP